MGYACYYDEKRKSHSGYGVPAKCDHPDCNNDIDRGVSYRCGGVSNEEGCGLFFCHDHLDYAYDEDGEPITESMVCPVCRHTHENQVGPSLDEYKPKTDVQEWIDHKLNDPSWSDWRSENPEWVNKHQQKTMREDG